MQQGAVATRIRGFSAISFLTFRNATCSFLDNDGK